MSANDMRVIVTVTGETAVSPESNFLDVLKTFNKWLAGDEEHTAHVEETENEWEVELAENQKSFSAEWQGEGYDSDRQEAIDIAEYLVSLYGVDICVYVWSDGGYGDSEETLYYGPHAAYLNVASIAEDLYSGLESLIAACRAKGSDVTGSEIAQIEAAHILIKTLARRGYE